MARSRSRRGGSPGSAPRRICRTGTPPPSIDGEGGWLTPGLIDCHTHLVFAGDRSGEFEQRLQGVSYEEIARAGGGIARTVAATRQASHSQLEAAARRRLGALMAEGVTTIEIKSGYGLDRDTEIKMLEVARRLGEAHPVDVRTTYLGAHALPKEYASDRAGYLDLVCTRVLPEVAERGLADAVDAFCEGIAFTPDEVARVFEAARALGLPVKLHADQLSDLGGAALAARFGALVRRSSRIRERGGHPGHGDGGDRRGAAARRVLYPARAAEAAGRAVAAATASPWLWRPTAIPAPHRSRRCARS